MKKGILAAIVKTPGHSPLKTRLARSIGTHRAEEFYKLSVLATEAYMTEALAMVPGLSATWAIAEPEGVPHSLWTNFPRMVLSAGDLGHRLGRTYAELLISYDYVLFIGADSPHVAPDRIREAVDALSRAAFCLGRTRDGGFYLFGGRKPVPLTHWTRVGYSQIDTADQLIETFTALGNFGYLQPEFDIDVVGDFEALRQELVSRPLNNPSLRELLKFIEALPSYPKPE